jgi:hypothetical protein
VSVQHVVLFRFPEPLEEAEAKEMRGYVEEWPARIGGFERLRFGTDLNDGARARGYQFLLLTEHADVAALRAYQQHPVHLAFSDWVFSRGCEVIAFDYELGPDTVIGHE